MFNVHAKPIILNVVGANFELLTFMLILSLTPIMFLIYKSLYPLEIKEDDKELVAESVSVRYNVRNIGLVNLDRIQLAYTFDFNEVNLTNLSMKPILKSTVDIKDKTFTTYTWELGLNVDQADELKFVVDKINPHAKIPKLKATILEEK
jgi:hypothetical protein